MRDQDIETMAKRYWLFKSEPDVYSINDLERDGSTSWEGVRNYQARNLLRDDVQVGDEVLFYHSRLPPMGVAGVGRVIRAGYPDENAFDPKHKYFDPKSKADNPTWYLVDIAHVETFPRVVTLAEMKDNSKLGSMMVTRRGARLSIQPVTPAEFQVVKRAATEPSASEPPVRKPPASGPSPRKKSTKTSAANKSTLRKKSSKKTPSSKSPRHKPTTKWPSSRSESTGTS